MKNSKTKINNSIISSPDNEFVISSNNRAYPPTPLKQQTNANDAAAVFTPSLLLSSSNHVTSQPTATATQSSTAFVRSQHVPSMTKPLPLSLSSQAQVQTAASDDNVNDNKNMKDNNVAIRTLTTLMHDSKRLHVHGISLIKIITCQLYHDAVYHCAMDHESNRVDDDTMTRYQQVRVIYSLMIDDSCGLVIHLLVIDG
jgi:hypothetical protein